MVREMIAKEGFVWAYKDGEEEIRMGNTLYLGANDTGERYYEVEEIVDVPNDLPNSD
mgnify:CR=1 FL=1